jgi:flagellar export protein FliJ
MAPPSALHSFIDMLAQKRDQARLRLAQAQRHVEEADRQLRELHGYSGEAQASWMRRAGNTMAVEVLAGQQNFANGLNRAIEFQEKLLRERKAQAQACTGVLLACEQRLNALTRLTEIRARANDRRYLRQEQKQADEMAMVSHMRRQNAQGSVR